MTLAWRSHTYTITDNAKVVHVICIIEYKIESAEQFDAEIKKIQEIFQEKESEHTWRGFDEALSRLTIMIQNGAHKYESSFLHGLKVLRNPILNSVCLTCNFKKQSTTIIGLKKGVSH